MMTTILFVIASVKQLRTGGSFRILLPFFRTSWGVGVLNSAIFNSFTQFGWVWNDFGGASEFRGGGVEPPTLTSLVRHWNHWMLLDTFVARSAKRSQPVCISLGRACTPARGRGMKRSLSVAVMRRRMACWPVAVRSSAAQLFYLGLATLICYILVTSDSYGPRLLTAQVMCSACIHICWQRVTLNCILQPIDIRSCTQAKTSLRVSMQ